MIFPLVFNQFHSPAPIRLPKKEFTVGNAVKSLMRGIHP
jgi:hypothetical protein